MCIQVVEIYATCGCIYHLHGVDECLCRTSRGHSVIKKKCLVGDCCSEHSFQRLKRTRACRGEAWEASENSKRGQDTILQNSVAEPFTIQHPSSSQAESTLDRQPCHPPKDYKIKDSGNAPDDHVSYPAWGHKTHPAQERSKWTTANNVQLTNDAHEHLHTEIEKYTTREIVITETLKRFAGVDRSDRAGVGGKEHGDVEYNVSDVESVFDNASVSSKSSIELPFAEEFYEELLRNVAIAVPVEIAVRLNANQFETTFTHLLRLFSKDLAENCLSSVEKGASKAIRVRSHFLALKLKNHFISSDLEDCQLRREARKAELPFDEYDGPTNLDNDAPDDDGPDDDGSIYPRMDYVKKFLFEDVPFVKLVQRLQMLVDNNSMNTDFSSATTTFDGKYNQSEAIISDADIAATAALIDIVARSLRQYTHAVGVTGKPVKHLLKEARDLLELVQILESHAKQTSSTGTRSIRRRHIYHSCLTLQRLRSLLEDAVSAKHALVSLRSRKENWPLSKDATIELIEELKIHKSTLSMVISMDTNAALFHSRLHEAEHGTTLESSARTHTQVTIQGRDSVSNADKGIPNNMATANDSSPYLYSLRQDPGRLTDQVQSLTQNPSTLALDMLARAIMLIVVIQRLQKRKNLSQGLILKDELDPSTSSWDLIMTNPPREHSNFGACSTSEAGNSDQMCELPYNYELNECFMCEDTPLLAKITNVLEVGWVCSCGKLFLESIEELRPLGIARFLEDVEKSFCRSPHDPQELSASNVWPRRNQIFVLLGRLLNTFDHAGHNFITCAAACDTLNAQVPPDVYPAQTAKIPTTSVIRKEASTCQQSTAFSNVSSSTELSQSAASSSGSDTLSSSYAWIHICVEYYAGRIQLKSVDIRGHCTDGPMFSKIHDAYFGTGYWRRLQRALSLRVLTGIEFVHFNIDRHKHVAIDRGDHQKLPPPKDYLYQPCPPALAGLIPRHFLYLCITKPDRAYGNYRHWRDRMPKYTGKDLRCLPDEPFTPGYGLYFMEGLSWIKVWLIMSLFTVLSFTFSGLWIRFHDGDSIQDAFAMGGCLLTVATILLGLLHGLDAFWSDRLRS